MALKKTVILENGIPMSYHRIAEIQNVVNEGTKIKILSYVNQEQRLKEKELKDRDRIRRMPMPKYGDLYIVSDTVQLPYNDTLDIVSAYEYLKTTEKYKDAEDIFEEGDE